MNILKFIIKKLYSEEIITIFFLLIVFFLYMVFGKPLNLFTSFTLWTSSIIIVFFVFKIIRNSVRVALYKDKQVDIHLAREVLSFIRLCLPLIVFVNIYLYLFFIIDKINPKVFDLTLMKMDEILFFGYNPGLVMEKFITPNRTQWFLLAYFSYYFYFPISFGVLFVQQRIKEFHILSLAAVFVAYLGFIGYLITPAVGPFYAMQDLFSVNLEGQPMAKLGFDFINTYGYAKGTFPSLHTAFSATFLFFAFRHQRKLFYLYLPFIISLFISTVYLRQHYVVDVIAGLALAWFALYAAPRVYNWWEIKRHENHHYPSHL